jgi:hypothetical protein
MTVHIFVFLGRATATKATKHRPGARHAVMLVGTGPDIASARSTAVTGAIGKGWESVELRREKQLDANHSAIGDDVIRNAVENAILNGHSIVVYRDELSADS